MENKVKELRYKIDEIDLKILDLIQSRAIHASKIGEIKKESPDFDGIFYKLPTNPPRLLRARSPRRDHSSPWRATSPRSAACATLQQLRSPCGTLFH